MHVAVGLQSLNTVILDCIQFMFGRVLESAVVQNKRAPSHSCAPSEAFYCVHNMHNNKYAFDILMPSAIRRYVLFHNTKSRIECFPENHEYAGDADLLRQTLCFGTKLFVWSVVILAFVGALPVLKDPKCDE